MDTQNSAELSEATITACAIATGRQPADPAAESQQIKAAVRDVDRKGNGTETYRRVLRSGEWTWLTSDRLPMPIDFRNRVFWLGGDVFPGELVARFDRQIKGDRSAGEAKLECFALVRTHEERAERMVRCTHKRRRDGQYAVTLPDGSTVVVPDPAWR
jgi:hypothetical protein